MTFSAFLDLDLGHNLFLYPRSSSHDRQNIISLATPARRSNLLCFLPQFSKVKASNAA